MIGRPPSSTLFPYTTLFRSHYSYWTSGYVYRDRDRRGDRRQSDAGNGPGAHHPRPVPGPQERGEHRRQRRLPHRRSRAEGRISGPRGGEDPGPDAVGRLRGGPAGHPGARAAGGGPAGRPPRAGARGWRGGGGGGRGAGRGRGGGRARMRLARAEGRARSVHPPGVDHGGRREPHDQRAPRARPGADRADPVHTGAHDAGRAARGGAGARGGGPSGQVRETAMRDGTIDRAIADIRAGKLVIVADDEDRENEGDLVGAAEKVTPEMINFMATHGRGLICLTLTPERCQT